MRVARATNGEKPAISRSFMLMTAMLAGEVLQRNIKANIALKNTT